MINERRVIADRQALAAARLDAAPAHASGTPTFAGQVYDGGAMPTVAPAWYLTNPVQFGCAESEGMPCPATADAQKSVPVIVLRGVPSVGDILIAELVGGRWVAELKGGHTPPHCAATVCVTGCPSGSELVGATVTIRTTGGTLVGTCTTTDDGAGHACCSISLDAVGGAGDYEVIVAKAGYKTFDGVRTLACNGTITIGLQPNTSAATVRFTVIGCCTAPLPGALITLSDGQSCVTDAAGQCDFWIGPAGTYSYAITKARFVTATGTFTIAGCVTTTLSIVVAMVPAVGYACGPTDEADAGLPDPLPITLSLTDSIYGGCTLTWDPVNLWWAGSFTASFAGGCNCPATSFTLSYRLFQCATQVSHYTLQVDWSSGDYGECILGSFFITRAGCPHDGPTTTCAGVPSGTNIYEVSSFVTELRYFGGIVGWSVTSPIPFDATFTIAPMGPCPPGSSGGARIPWPAGGTITITE